MCCRSGHQRQRLPVQDRRERQRSDSAGPGPAGQQRRDHDRLVHHRRPPRWAANQTYNVACGRAIGERHGADRQLWPTGTAEPTAWQVQCDRQPGALQAAGGVGINSYLSSGRPPADAQRGRPGGRHALGTTRSATSNEDCRTETADRLHDLGLRSATCRQFFAEGTGRYRRATVAGTPCRTVLHRRLDDRVRYPSTPPAPGRSPAAPSPRYHGPGQSLRADEVDAHLGLPAGGPGTDRRRGRSRSPRPGSRAPDHEGRVVDDDSDTAGRRVGDVAIDTSTCCPAYADRSKLTSASRRSFRSSRSTHRGSRSRCTRFHRGEVVQQERVAPRAGSRLRTPPEPPGLVSPPVSTSVVQLSWPTVCASTMTLS